MIIVRFTNVLPFVGYMKVEPRGLVRFYFADLGTKDSGTRKIATEDLIVTDLELYKAIHKLSVAVSEKENLQVYFQYVDMKYPTYSFT